MWELQHTDQHREQREALATLKIAGRSSAISGPNRVVAGALQYHAAALEAS
jgi:hypothetical protein